MKRFKLYSRLNQNTNRGSSQEALNSHRKLRNCQVVIGKTRRTKHKRPQEDQKQKIRKKNTIQQNIKKQHYQRT